MNLRGLVRKGQSYIYNIFPIDNIGDQMDKKLEDTKGSTTIATLVDSILATDLQELLQTNTDVECSSALKTQISYYKPDTLLKITKEIGSIKIINIEEIKDEYLIKKFDSV